MLKSKPTSILKKKNDDDNQSDSDTSLEKYYQGEDLISSSSSSPTSKSSPIAALEPKKMFIKKPAAKKDEFKFGDEIKLTSSDDNNPLRQGLRRPLNPLAKPDIQLSFVADSLGSTIPDKKDETPLSTMKLGSDTLDEEQEKAEFFRTLEKNKGQNKIDYGILNQQIESDLSPPKNGKVINSFDKQINQMSTPLHHQPNDNIVKESLSNELDREIEQHEKQKLNTTTTIKHVTIAEPPARPSASIDDFSRTGKTTSDFLTTATTTTTSDTTRDLHMLHNAYKQNISSMPTTRVSRTPISDPKKKIQQQKPTTTKNLSKPNIQTPTKKGSPSPVARPKTAPAPAPIPKQNENKDSILIEQLKLDKEFLTKKIESLETVHEEQLRNIRQENYILQAKTSQLTNSDGKKEIVPLKQREVNELEKLIDGYQIENEKLCKQIKQIEQQHKQIEQSMFDENEKLRQELIQTKMFLEQYQNSHSGTIKKQSSTIILTNLVDNEKSENSSENQRLKNEIIVLKNKLTSTLNKEFKSEDDDTLRSLDQRRIKDLERQVKELELINRRRHQNPTTQVGMVLNPLDDRNQLEIKLTKAEEALRQRQISEEKLLHELNVLEEKYSLMKQMYTNNGSLSTTNGQFEKQLHDILNKNKNLSGQVHLRHENERLKTELEKLKIPKPAKSLKRDLETIKLLRTDIERKNDELEKLRALYDAVTVQHKSLLAEREREKTRLAIMGNKPYQPDRFTQVLSPIEAINAENEQLKHLVEKLEHNSQQKHAELMHLRDDQQSVIAVAVREKENEILRLRQQHKLELQTIINEMSSNTTETRVSDLLRKIESQDATIVRLKKLTEHTDENARELAVLRVQDDELKSTINRLEQELIDARSYHTPEMKHFQELQNKINQLEQRWYKRDKITKDYTNSLIKQHDLDTNNDVNKLRSIIKQKNQEIERFHIELDSMLELLKTLKFQQLLYN